MSPLWLAAIFFQIAWLASWWRCSVVRMKSSLEMSSASARRRNSAELRSASSRGVTPCVAAVCTILMPCSSVPVRK
ncbi:hypothetical protein D3C86_2092080 [compost metagenome]